MLNLSVYTKLSPTEVLDRAQSHFVEEQGLTFVEIIAHLHAETGACEIRVSGEDITGNGEYSSNDVLMSQVHRLESDFGLHVVYYGLHIHASTGENVGHLMVTINAGDTVEVNFESHELDFPAKAFADRLPKVKTPVEVK